MTIMINPFDAGGYSLAEMTSAINILPNVYTRLGQMGLFRFDGITKRSVIIEQAEGVLNLLPTVPLGGPATVEVEHGPVTEITYEDWRRILAITLDSAFIFTKACMPTMIRNGGGCIITLGGITALRGDKGRAHVAAAKHGLVGFTKAMANDLAEHHIRVNCVSPGQIDTSRAPGNERPNRVAQIPLGRLGSVDDIAAAVCFLAADEAAYITGHVLAVNGGMYM